MKRSAVSVILLTFSLSMGFCAVWSSNALGQLLEEKDSLSFAGWEREEKENLAILYFDGKEMWRKETLEDGERILEENVETRLFFSEDGRILRKTVDDGENFAEYNYNYSSSLFISSSTLSLDGVVVERVSYTLSPDGVLLSMEKDGNPIYFTQDRMVRSGEDGVESYLYSEDDDGDVEWLENGGYRENTPSGYKEYDGNGRLILSYENGISTRYSYSMEGELLSSVFTKDGKTIETKYVNSRPYTVETRNSDGTVEKVRKSLSDGTYEETRYVDGKAKYIFHLDRDGERILEARGL